jgi:diguanylate cyclase (GGDEF)-like protein
MSDPFDVLCLAASPPVLGGPAAAAYGRFRFHPCADLADAAVRLVAQRFDALLIDAPDAAALRALLAWPALTDAVADTAVLVRIPAVTARAVAQVVTLLQRGVQDAMPPVEGPDLARALRQAIERKRLEKVARQAYAIDLATGLPNRMQLLEHMTHLIALRAREPAPMALIALRIAGLGVTEDALGQEAANVLKRKVAVRLRAGLRASDVVASLGGDAFAVLLAWMDAPDAGERVAGKLAADLTRSFTVTGRECHVGVRAGLASFPTHGERAEDLLRRALDQATSMAVVGIDGSLHAADRGPWSAANDDD